jgi:tetratricopeptide (TPR) repeat protein
MKNGKNLMLIGAFLISAVAFGQDYTFKVLANKGANEVKSGDTWQAVKTGSSLKSGDELKVSENAYLGLVHSSGKPVELKTAGNYKVADLAGKVGGGTTVLNKYTDFILSSNSAEAKKNRLSATGAVHRGLEDIKVYLPENQNSGIYNNIAIINWESAKSTSPFVVTLKNMFDDELMKIETAEATVQIDLNDSKFANESAILVEVKSKADPKSKSEQHLIKKLSAADREKVKKSMSAEIPLEVTQTESPLNKLLLASFYEQNKLYIDAITSYEQAIKMAPDVPTYSENYEEFLLRNKLKTAAK